MAKRITALVVIELTRERLRAVEVRPGDRDATAGPRVDEEFRLNPLSDEADLVGRELRSRLHAAGIRARAAIFCPPLDQLLVQTIDLDGVAPEDLESLIALEAERAFPFPSDELIAALSRFTNAAGSARGCLAVLPVAAADQLAAIARHAGLRVVGIRPALPVTLAARSGGAEAALRLTEHELQFAVAAPDGIALLRAFQSMRPTLARDAAEADALAEELRREFRLTLRRVQTELGAAPRRIHLSGAADDCRRFMAWYRREFADSPELVYDDSASSTEHSILAALAATGRAALAGERPGFDYWRPAEGRWQTGLRRWRARGVIWRAAAVALALGAIAVAAVAWHVWSLRRLERRWAAIAPRVERLAAMQEGLRARRAWLSAEPEQLALLHTLTGAFPETGSVWARTLVIRNSEQTVQCVGLARSNRDCLAVFEALRQTAGVQDLQVVQVEGGDPIQFTLSYHWQPEGAR